MQLCICSSVLHSSFPSTGFKYEVVLELTFILKQKRVQQQTKVSNKQAIDIIKTLKQ